jgi:hypothetical protein
MRTLLAAMRRCADGSSGLGRGCTRERPADRSVAPFHLSLQVNKVESVCVSAWVWVCVCVRQRE